MTPRVAEVAKLLAQKLSDRQIADRLGISVETVKGYVKLAYKAGAQRRTK